jgi:AGZA family xanthine/uracil permease-like MFS transporter
MLPLFQAIPSPAIYPVLVIVGILMFTELGKMNFETMDIATASAAFFTILLMPLTYSITNGLSAGFVAFTLLKMVQGKFSELNIGIYLITFISLIVFIVH